VSEITKFKDLSDFEFNSDPSIMADNPGTVTFSSKLNDMNHDEEDYSPPPF
jgi:hypothetical protein